MNHILNPKRWAIQWPAIPKHPCAVPEVRGFSSEDARDLWVSANPRRREAVGVNNPHVKAYRRSKEGARPKVRG